MSCRIELSDEVIVLNGQNVYVKSMGILSMDDFLKCEVPKDLNIKMNSTLDSPVPQNPEKVDSPQSYQKVDLQAYYNNMLNYQQKIRMPSNTMNQNMHQQPGVLNSETFMQNPNEWLNPNQAVNAQGENSLVTIIVLVLSALFGGGKVLQLVGNRFTLKQDSDETNDNLLAKINQEIAKLEKFTKDTFEAHETKMSQIDDEIKELDSMIAETSNNNQKLLKRYEILLGDDTPDIEEISIRLRKVERIIKYITEHRNQISNKKETTKENQNDQT